MSGRQEKDEDDWETDPDYVNTMTEEQQRWGGARDTGVLDMDKLRERLTATSELTLRQGENGFYPVEAPWWCTSAPRRAGAAW